MGNCLRKDGKNLNENSNVQRKLRIGIGLKKGEDGEFHFGLEGGFEKRKRKEFSEIGEKRKINFLDICEISKKEKSMKKFIQIIIKFIGIIR